MERLSGVFETIPIWFVWPVLVGIAVYWYLTKDDNYWKQVGIPYIEPVPIIGSVVKMIFAKNVHEFQLDKYKKLGRIHGMYIGSSPTLFIGDPDILKDILVKDFQFFTSHRSLAVGEPLLDNMVSVLKGEDWKRVRTVMTPAFSTGKIKRMVSIFSDSAKTLIGNFKAASKEGKPVDDMKRFFGAFTMDVIASSAFATKIDSHNNPDNPFVTHAKKAFTNPFPWRFILFFTFPKISRLFRIGMFPPGAMKFFQQVTLNIIEERKKSKQKPNDFLQLMIDAVERVGEKETEDVNENDEIKQMGHEEENEKVFKSYQSTKSLSNIEMIANSVIFFLAGFETTAATLTFASYELAVNPDVQDKAINEIDEAIKEKGGLNYEALCEMKYLDNIIFETLRKYPPASGTDRLVEEDYDIKFGDKKVTLKKGMVVGIPIYSMHHDPEHYPDPSKFDPDRFSQEQKSKRHPYTYLPFGAGPRNCVGMRFALMEIKVCLANILSQCRLNTCSKTEVPLTFVRSFGFLQTKQVVLKVEPRNVF